MVNTQTPVKEIVLELRNISKSFPGVRALSEVQLSLEQGEVHALLGENGAGKSTLMKILFGIYQPDAGEILLNGNPARIPSPHIAQQMGIAMVHQELNLIPALNVGRNIFLGREPMTAFGLINWPKLYQDTQQILNRLHLNNISPRTLVRRLSVAQQQMVEIAHALSWNPKVLIFDEPTSSLTQQEITELFRIIRVLRESGVSILYISHRLDELEQIADRATVLRDGQFVGTVDARTTPIPQLIRMMVGRSLDQLFPKVRVEPGTVVLQVEGLTRRGAFQNISFSVRKGEIVGMAGLVGAGRSEVARTIFGVDSKDAGRILVEGREVNIRLPQDAIKAGIGLLPEDRKTQGLVLALSVKVNASLTVLDKLSRLGFINFKARDEMTSKAVKDLRIRTPNINFRVRNLSGGNQQKVVIAKWLAAKPKVLIFDEPTRGIDVGAKVEVYNLMTELAQSGVGIILISSELPEVLGMSDRILVMHEGQLVAEVPRNEATQEKILSYASGEKASV